MKSFKAEFDRRGVAIAIVSFAEPATLNRYQEYHHWPFEILSDPKRLAYDSFGLKKLSLFRLFSLSTVRLYLRLLREGKRLQNYGKDDYYQAGGDFVVDRRGNVLFAHRSHDPSDRPAISELLEAIDRAKKDLSHHPNRNPATAQPKGKR